MLAVYSLLSTILILVSTPAYAEASEATLIDLPGVNEIVDSNSYWSEFASISNSIAGRADAPVREDLANNVPAKANTVSPGQRQLYRFPSSVLHGTKSSAEPVIPTVSKRDQELEHAELRKRATDVRYYLTLSVCSQPTSTTNSQPPPQLVLIVSYDNPNADGTQPNAHAPVVSNGFGSFSDPTSGDIFIGVEAPSKSGYIGSYTFELVVSIDDYYSNYVDSSTLYWLDSDPAAALFVSRNLTKLTSENTIDPVAVASYVVNVGPRYSVVVANATDRRYNGLMHSYCALKNTTQAGSASADQQGFRVETGLTSIGGAALQQKFYLSGLARGTKYVAAMGISTNYSISGSGRVGGGGTIYKQLEFTTKQDDNCRIIYNLTFCDKVNYAVPANKQNFGGPNLTTWYDQQARSHYQFFDNALQQVACETTPDAQYSLAVTCDDCKAAYKDWLCAVTAPRCDDYTSTKSYLHPRAISYPFQNGTFGNTTTDPQFNSTFQNLRAYNSSRNPQIDEIVQPGPYKELLPCGDTCYKLVRSCPAVMGFACPYDPQGYNHSYGYPLMDGQYPQCNSPGAVFGLSAANSLSPSVTVLIGFALLAVGFG